MKRQVAAVGPLARMIKPPLTMLAGATHQDRFLPYRPERLAPRI